LLVVVVDGDDDDDDVKCYDRGFSFQSVVSRFLSVCLSVFPLENVAQEYIGRSSISDNITQGHV
jgi:hypothetical protein